MVGAMVLAAITTGVFGVLMKSSIIIILAFAIFLIPFIGFINIPWYVWGLVILLLVFAITKKKWWTKKEDLKQHS